MRTRVRARDRGWLDLDSLRVLGPFDGVTGTGLRTALAGIHSRQPDHPAVRLLDRDAAEWVRLSTEDFAAHARHAVVPVPDPGGPEDAAADAVARYLLATPADRRPLVLAVCRGYVGAKVCHAVGDGRVINALLPELIRAAARHRPAGPPVTAAGALPLARAALHHFGRHPGRLFDLFPLALPPEAANAAPPPATSVVARPWRPDPAYVSLRSPGAPGRIRAWRDRHLPGVSASAIQFAALAAALERCGLPARGPGAVVLVDARRYLPTGCGADGNFCWGVYLRPARLTDPRAVHEALAEQLAAGSALAMLGLRTGRLLLASPRRGAATGQPGAATGQPDAAAGQPDAATGQPGAAAGQPDAEQWTAADARPRLTFTHIGRLDAYRDLPWAAQPAYRRNISAPTTSGPDALTVSFSELAGVLHLNASFHRSTFDPDVVRRAVELACRYPVELLSGTAVV